MANMHGGFSDTSAATEKIQAICDEVKPQVEEITHKKYTEFKAISYRKQLVAGLIFLIKVEVGRCCYLHLKVFQNLPCYGGEIKVLRVQQDHGKDDPLVPF